MAVEADRRTIGLTSVNLLLKSSSHTSYYETVLNKRGVGTPVRTDDDGLSPVSAARGCLTLPGPPRESLVFTAFTRVGRLTGWTGSIKICKEFFDRLNRTRLIDKSLRSCHQTVVCCQLSEIILPNCKLLSILSKGKGKIQLTVEVHFYGHFQHNIINKATAYSRLY